MIYGGRGKKQSKYAGRRHRAEEAPGLLIATLAQQEKQGIMPYSLIFIILAVAFHFGEFIARKGEPGAMDQAFAADNLYYLGLSGGGFMLAFLSAGFTFGFITPGFKFLGPKDTFFNGKMIGRQLTISLGITVVVLAVFGFILKPIFATISVYERIIYYATGAISEEMWYRFFIQNTATGLLRKIPIKAFKAKTTTAYLLTGFIALIPTSLYFMSAHANVYANDPIAFIGTFFTGFAFGIGLLISNNILIAIIPHMVNNFFTALWQVLLPSMTGAVNAIQFIFTIIYVGLICTYALLKKRSKQDANNKITKQETTVDNMTKKTEQTGGKKITKRQERIFLILGIAVIVFLVIEVIFGNIFFSWYIMQTGPP
jgi:membrane protease YdiL (CAAX protease family)